MSLLTLPMCFLTPPYKPDPTLPMSSTPFYYENKPQFSTSWRNKPTTNPAQPPLSLYTPPHHPDPLLPTRYTPPPHPDHPPPTQLLSSAWQTSPRLRTGEGAGDRQEEGGRQEAGDRRVEGVGRRPQEAATTPPWTMCPCTQPAMLWRPMREAPGTIPWRPSATASPECPARTTPSTQRCQSQALSATDKSMEVGTSTDNACTNTSIQHFKLYNTSCAVQHDLCQNAIFLMRPVSSLIHT